MLSILIPVYNFEIADLVHDLYKQCKAADIIFEILCFDDGSMDHFKSKNQSIRQYPEISFKALSKNQGRSKIRNTLGKAAHFDYLLFMDCDSKVNSSNYIDNYLQHLNPESVLYGGRSYAPNPPAEQVYYFHWYYGSHREEQKASIRKIKPYHSFMTNNFVIPKQLFLDLLFDESLTQYGHEDTIFGLELKQRRIPILHLENPLEHIGLEATEVFLAKSKKAIENLHYLYQKNPLISTKLLRTFKGTKKLKLHGLLHRMYSLSEQKILENIYSPTPNLRYFDFLKLAHLIALERHN